MKVSWTVNRRICLTIACIGISLAPALASGEGGGGGGADRQDMQLEFTTDRPGAASDLLLSIDYMDPQDPNGKPPAVRKVVETLGRRALIDTSAPRLCTATDAELVAQGKDACPRGSRVGTGVITLDTGVPGPSRFIIADVLFLNNTKELIFLNTVRDGGERVVVRAKVRGRRTYVNNAPFLPGVPPDGTAIDTVEVTLGTDRLKQGDSYITTPSRCPERGFRWNRIKFTYDDGVKQAERDRWRCEGGR